MPRYTYECVEHGTFDLVLPLREWDDPKPCKKCGKPSSQVVLPQGEYGKLPQPIVIHENASGKVRFPGSADAKVPKGFQRRELTTIREVEQFETRMNHKLREEARDHQENEERYFGEGHRRLRSELRMKMQSMSQQGQDFARFAMEQNNQRKRKSTEVGFHVDILHNDSSTREPWRDERTGWKRRYY